MLEERSAAAVVITGNTIVVMGGIEKAGRVRSVEAFTLDGYSWRYPSAMRIKCWHCGYFTNKEL